MYIYIPCPLYRKSTSDAVRNTCIKQEMHQTNLKNEETSFPVVLYKSVYIHI